MRQFNRRKIALILLALALFIAPCSKNNPVSPQQTIDIGLKLQFSNTGRAVRLQIDSVVVTLSATDISTIRTKLDSVAENEYRGSIEVDKGNDRKFCVEIFKGDDIRFCDSQLTDVSDDMTLRFSDLQSNCGPGCTEGPDLTQGDLVVDIIHPAQDTPVLAGNAFPVRWSVKNQGNAVIALRFADSLWIVNTLADTVYRDGVAHNNVSLSTGDSVVSELDIPGTLSTGDYEIVLMTDADRMVIESDENNNSDSLAIAITDSMIVSFKDLIIETISAPESANAGETISVTWVVKNIGTETVREDYFENVYVNSASTTGGSLLTMSEPHMNDLAPGDTLCISDSVLIPQNLQGSYYLVVESDAGNNVFEDGNEGNNVAAQAIEITTVSPDGKDLIIETITAQDNAVAGQKILIKWIVKNIGTETITGTYFENIYLNSTPTPGGTLLTMSESHMTDLAPDEMLIDSASVSIPQGLQGAYYLVVKADADNNVDEDNENNNITSAPIQVEILPADIQITNLDVPSTAFLGDTVSVIDISYDVANLGYTTAEGGFSEKIFISNSPDTLGSNTTLLKEIMHDEDLGFFAFIPVIDSVAIPSSFFGPNYIVVVGDAGDKVDEGIYEGNNISVEEILIGSGVDLVIENITFERVLVPIETVAIDTQFTVRWDVQNLGNIDVNSDFQVEVWVSADKDSSGDDSLVADTTFTGLEMNSTESLSSEIAIPASFASFDEVYIIVFADPEKAVSEKNEMNNTGSQVIQIKK